MSQLPCELLISVFSLVCAEDTRSIEQKLRLAQVCAYWRAVALDYRTFWTRIRIKTLQDAALLPIVLAHSGHNALDVELCWEYPIYHLPSKSPLSGAETRAVVDALLVPAQRLRLKRLYVFWTAPMPKSLDLLLGAGLTFPALEHLEVHGACHKLDLVPCLETPLLRSLLISKLCVQSWDTLIPPSLERLDLSQAEADDAAALLAAILNRCYALEDFGWDVECPSLTSTDMWQHSLAPRLKMLRLGRSVESPYNFLTFFNKHRADLIPVHDITVTVYHVGPHLDREVVQVLGELFHQTGSLVDLRVDVSQEELVIRDDVGRIRRLIVWDEDGVCYVPQHWRTLSTHHGIDHSLRSLRMRTDEWHLFGYAFSEQPPTALTELCILIREDLKRFTYDQPTSTLSVPKLCKVTFVPDGDRVQLITRLRMILPHIECDASDMVEVCISECGRREWIPRQEIVLGGLSDKWVLCNRCACF
ncbi:hypothetical protein EXIGLDRAFT_728288 [Exidia glandulosa HHB12029]|uniref:F-box domain-containing protein n=1 Tax=Exidia glandulosa HHB12029 TaxID=1314781 RepID=A0A165CZH4_EXIGL|nr:hypothetical protein EXIGLDRAFT_728288 [Exidia glandulosa HHB12029]